jgi:Zn-dependent protease with chaperone function
MGGAVMSVSELFFPLMVAGFLAILVVMFQAHLTPSIAARLAAASTISIALVGYFGAVLVAAQFWAHLPLTANWAENWMHWCEAMNDSHMQVSAWSGVVASVIVVVGVARCIRYLVARRSARARQISLSRMVTGCVAIADDPSVFAYSIPGRKRLTIVSSGLLAALNAREQSVVLAHEEGHYRYRHDRYLHVAKIAALLFAPAALLRQGLEYALERWADEHAGTVVGDREFVAVTVARTSLIASHATMPVGVMGFSSVGPFGTTQRVKALLRPPVSSLVLGPMQVCALGIATAVAIALATQIHHFDGVIRTLCGM